MFPAPINLPKWLEENSHLLKPPVGNYCVYDKGMTVMVVGGPNSRSDFHINPTPELFYQYRGSMLLRTAQHPNGADTPPEITDVPIHEGSIFLLPPDTPHCPIRFADTVGIVVELPRPEGKTDALRWYCPNESCRNIVHEALFPLVDLGTQIKEGVQAFEAKGDDGRRCQKCGTVVKMKAEGVVQPRQAGAVSSSPGLSQFQRFRSSGIIVED